MDTAYVFADSVDQAVALLGEAGGRARVMAGGTDLMLALPRRYARPEIIVDITRIPNLDRIEVDPEWVSVGATVTFLAIQEHTWLRGRVPALVEAAASMGARPLQAVATLIGNIVQAMPGGDGAVVAVALGADARVADETGACWVPVERLYRSAKESAVDSTRQVVSHVRFRTPPSGWGCAWHRLARRPSLALPIVNCAATLQLAPAGTIEQATIALGPMGDRPWRATAVETWLSGQRPSADVWQAAGQMTEALSDPRSSPLRASRAYRLAVIAPLVVRALWQAADRAASVMDLPQPVT